MNKVCSYNCPANGNKWSNNTRTLWEKTFASTCNIEIYEINAVGFLIALRQILRSYDYCYGGCDIFSFTIDSKGNIRLHMVRELKWRWAEDEDICCTQWTVRLMEPMHVNKLLFKRVLTCKYTGSTLVKMTVLENKIFESHEHVFLVISSVTTNCFCNITEKSFWNANCHYHLMTGHKERKGVALLVPMLGNWYFTHAWRLGHAGKSYLVLICSRDTVQHFSISPLIGIIQNSKTGMKCHGSLSHVHTCDNCCASGLNSVYCFGCVAALNLFGC